MFNIFINILGSFTFIAFGIIVINTGVLDYGRWDIVLDFNDERWPIKWFFGGVFIAFGIMIIINILRKKSSIYYQREKTGRLNLICPRCDQAFPYHEHSDFKCPKCGGGLEELAGYYERHPELRDAKKKGDTSSPDTGSGKQSGD